MIKPITNLTLYRSDPKRPPKMWDTTFFQDRYNSEVLGRKNAAGLFFFADTEEIAIWFERASKRPIYVTTCTTASEINLLDLTGSQRILQVLRLLERRDINVINNEFRLYENDDRDTRFATRFAEPLATLNDFDKLDDRERLARSREMFALANAINIKDVDVHKEVSVFGQRITDFANGPLFKTILEEKGLDGYMWNEGDQGAITYCFINSDKLSPPKTTKISWLSTKWIRRWRRRLLRLWD